ncbi:STAS domain-containing protein [Streptomyces sp. R302]|uniref:STAS domain-containing protein n=1 Tax=unclassified Streptomyces TaxID=2593676 RepID=UPI00145C5A5C|nr:MULTISPECIES: STAS domain-containing protein [unclassified Streptomyces]NML50845.1 STAS domain-containing protein [Streptomyces sp. R301]NML80939.1 STAS domain-containing protein [Streptomyces sp. R302]
MTRSPAPPPPASPGDRAGERLRHRTEARGAGTVVRLGGEIDLDNAGELETVLTAALSLAGHGAPLTLDLSEVSFCDSTGLNTLLHVRLLAEARHSRLSVVSASARVARLLDLTRTADLLGFPAAEAPPGGDDHAP